MSGYRGRMAYHLESDVRTEPPMKFLLLAIAACWCLLSVGCGGNEVCKDDHCVCAGDQTCVHDCTQGGLDCNIQCGTGTCDVGCVPGETCHVQCAQGKNCEVDCGGANDCHVTCPASGCTVRQCVGDCIVSCGLAGGVATKNGTTATCP